MQRDLSSHPIIGGYPAATSLLVTHSSLPDTIACFCLLWRQHHTRLHVLVGSRKTEVLGPRVLGGVTNALASISVSVDQHLAHRAVQESGVLVFLRRGARLLPPLTCHVESEWGLVFCPAGPTASTTSKAVSGRKMHTSSLSSPLSCVLIQPSCPRASIC